MELKDLIVDDDGKLELGQEFDVNVNGIRVGKYRVISRSFTVNTARLKFVGE